MSRTVEGGRDDLGGQPVRRKCLRIMRPSGPLWACRASERKLFKTPERRHVDVKTLEEEVLGIIIRGARSGSETKKRVYCHISGNLLY
jgi:hypothetical protein